VLLPPDGTRKHLQLTLIVAVSDNWVIGKNGNMPWGMGLKDDMKNFRITTSGPKKHVVMGRKTYEVVGYLKNRENIVLTNKKGYRAPQCKVAHHPNYILALAESYDVYIIGGSEIYNLFLPHVEKMIVTHVHTTVFNGDAFFPEISPQEWRATPPFSFEQNERNVHPFDIVEYTRKPRL
jgi:dihydrofolate reductase